MIARYALTGRDCALVMVAGTFLLGGRAGRGALCVVMKLIFGRISSAFVAIAWAVLFGARLVLDLIGYSTAPEDINVAQTRLDQFIWWLLSVPWWALLGLAFASTLWLIWVSWPRQQQGPPLTTEGRSSGPSETGGDEPRDTPRPVAAIAEQEAAETALMLFFLDYIRPAVRAQQQLQESMLNGLHGDSILTDFAIGGIKARTHAVEELWRSLDYLDTAFSSSPRSEVPLSKMINHIARIEVHYQYLCTQADDLGSRMGIDYRKEYKAEWDEWRNAHNTLKTAYDNEIKRSRRFGRLFRPARESFWGATVAPIEL